MNPQFGTEPSKMRPVVVVQTDLLYKMLPSTIVCPITTNVQTESDILRVHLMNSENNLTKDSDIMVDQLRSIDNKKLIKRIGKISEKMWLFSEKI